MFLINEQEVIEIGVNNETSPVGKVSGNSIQDIVFQKIKEKIGPDKELSQQLVDVLGIGIHSAYRRLRKDVPLTLIELEKLINHFRLNIFEQTNETATSYYFHGSSLDEKALDYRNALYKYESYMKQFNQMGTKHISYYGIDIMPFRLMSSPIMLAFQEYFWNFTLENKKRSNEVLLSLENISIELVDLAYYFSNFIQHIPTCEIWSPMCLDALISQIVYLKETHRFASEKDFEIVCKEMNRIIDFIEMQASRGYKTDWLGRILEPKVPFKMYISDLFISENNFCVQTNQQNFAIIKHNLFSFMFTNNTDFVEMNLKIFKSLVRKSQPISSINEKARIAFFNQLRQRIENKFVGVE